MEFVDRRSPHPFSARHNVTHNPTSDTSSFAKCGHLSMEVRKNRRLAMVRQLSPNSIALASPPRVPHRELQRMHFEICTYVCTRYVHSYIPRLDYICKSKYCNCPNPSNEIFLDFCSVAYSYLVLRGK